MIPHFSDLARSEVARVQVLPPPRFRPLQGTPRNVTMKRTLGEPSKGLTAAQKAGLRYEAKAQLHLRSVFGPSYRTAPLLHFEDDSGWRTCIPDGIYVGSFGLLVIFEIKSQHCPEAWWQLRRLYQPVVEALRFVKDVSVCEVTKSFDPMMPFPELVKQASLAALSSSPESQFCVHIWRPNAAS